MPAPVITPAGPLAMRGNQTQQFTADQAVAWTCQSPGVITSGGLYTAPNKPGSFTVTATNVNGSDQVTVTVTPVLAYDPDVGSEGGARKIVKASEGTRRRRWTRRRSGAVRFYDLKFGERPEAETEAVLALWEACWPVAPFYWRDPMLVQERLFIFDGPVSYTRVSRGVYDYKFPLKEWVVYGPGMGVTPTSSVFPFIPDYGLELEVSAETFSSDAPDMSRAARSLAGTTKARSELGFYSRPPAELVQVEGIWNYHYPGREITFQHGSFINLTDSYLIDSDLSWTYSEHNLVDYKFAVREA